MPWAAPESFAPSYWAHPDAPLAAQGLGLHVSHNPASGQWLAGRGHRAPCQAGLGRPPPLAKLRLLDFLSLSVLTYKMGV